MNAFWRQLGRGSVTAAERERQFRRLMVVETNIMLPVKIVAIICALVFYRNVQRSADTPLVAQVYIAHLNLYTAGNLVFWLLLLAARLGNMWPRTLRFSAFWLAMLDHVFLSGLIYFTEGINSPLYWLYLGLFIRSALDFPAFWQQLMLNLGACLCYTLAVVLNEESWYFFGGEFYWLRLTVLLLLGICCWGVTLLLERDREREAVLQEFQVREQKLAAAGRLAAEIAHQLKNPLGIINNAAYLLQTQGPAESTPATVTLIRDEVARSDKILTQLLNYARLSEGRIEPVDVNATLTQVIELARAAVPAAGVEIVRHLAPGLPAVPAQRAELEECFLNLVRNALEAMPGGGLLTVVSRDGGADRVEVRITDTGPGINADNLPRLFDPFFTTKAGGTGLGLAIVKNVVETYDGSVQVESTPGQGTCFSVVLPVRTARRR